MLAYSRTEASSRTDEPLAQARLQNLRGVRLPRHRHQLVLGSDGERRDVPAAGSEVFIHGGGRDAVPAMAE